MIIKLDSDKDGTIFYPIEVEELWNPDKVIDSFVTANYIHAQYHPSKKAFNHNDFSVNQYSLESFEKRYKDVVTDTSVP